MPPTELQCLQALETKILWLSCWTIHNANYLREKSLDEVKVGGHQASCASATSLLTTLYFSILNAQDRVAVKPHASPVFHAIQYLMGRQSLEKLLAFRAFQGAQAYPSRTKDSDDVDFSTGSVGLGVAATAFASLIQDYIESKPSLQHSPLNPGRMVAIVGDAELDEGNVYECLQEGWKQHLRRTWWIVDYNRQSLDGVVHEGLYQRIESVFSAFGWEVVRIKFGALQRKVFARKGGQALREWIESCPNALYSALTFQGGAAWRARLMQDIGDQGTTSALLDSFSDGELQRLMSNLGGHCIESLQQTFRSIDHDRPVLFIAYTIKGWGTPLAGHKDNHAGLMTPQQMENFQKQMGIPSGKEWDKFEALPVSPHVLRSFLAKTPFFQNATPRNPKNNTTPIIAPPSPILLREQRASTQSGFGKILDAIGKSDHPFADRIVTASPDVTVSTNLGSWVNRRALFARTAVSDTFREHRIPSTQKWRFEAKGQHIELGIAEMNLFILLAVAGLSHKLFDTRLIPIGTLYDPFIARGLDALNYACYQEARFLLVATPSGVSLSHEGGAHQSIASPLIGMSQDGLVSFEPAFLDELAVLMEWAFRYLQRSEHEGNFEERGGSVYLRLSTRVLEQPPPRDVDPAFRDRVIAGAYWLRPPGVNAEVVLAYQGCIAPEVIAAAGLLAEDRRDIGVLSITSADRLHAEWLASARRGGEALSPIEQILGVLPSHTLLVTVIDGHPATLSWLGGVRGHRCIALGVEHFGQTGTTEDLYRYNGIDTDSIVSVASRCVVSRPVRYAREMEL